MVIQRTSPTPVLRATAPAAELKLDGPVDTVAIGQALSDRLSAQFAGSMAAGESLSFTTTDGHKLIVNGAGGPKVENWVSNLKNFIQAGAQEVNVAVQAGPNLALSGVAEVVKPLVTTGIPDDAAAYVGQWYTPAIRAVSIGLSLKNFVERYHANQTKTIAGQKLSGWDKVGMVADAVHVGTAAAGVLGALAGAVLPQFRTAAMVGMGIATAGDVGRFGLNIIEYLDKRGHVEALPVPEPDPQPPPPLPPTTPPAPPSPPSR